jgi:hypothetical protein
MSMQQGGRYHALAKDKQCFCPAKVWSLKLLGGFANLQACLERMYARPAAPQCIADAFAEIRAA